MPFIQSTLVQLNYASSINTVSVASSPYIYTNGANNEVDVGIGGGTVTSIELSRNGTDYYPVGLIGGVYRLSLNDKLRLTYAVAPSMIAIGR